MKQKFTLGMAGLCCFLSVACKGYQEVGEDGIFKSPSIYSSQDVLPKLTCTQGMSLQPKDGSFVSWQVTRFDTITGKRSPFLGSNAVFGQLNIPNGDLSKASAILNFDISSTFSDDPRRDERIHTFIFGEAEGLVLRFTLQGFREEAGFLSDASSENLTAFGELEVGGQRTTVELPVILKSRVGSMTLTPSKLFALDMRALSPKINGVNLVERISHMLTYVDNIDIENEVLIDFNIEFYDKCTP